MKKLANFLTKWALVQKFRQEGTEEWKDLTGEVLDLKSAFLEALRQAELEKVYVVFLPPAGACNILGLYSIERDAFEFCKQHDGDPKAMYVEMTIQ